MTKKKLKNKKKALQKIFGTTEKPRLSVFRSNKHIYAQLINDEKGHTLVSSTTLEILKLKKKQNSSLEIISKKKEFSYLIGENLGRKATSNEISKVVFDRGNKLYHGRIQKLAEGAREEGLLF